jgi:hypothetical protein
MRLKNNMTESIHEDSKQTYGKSHDNRDILLKDDGYDKDSKSVSTMWTKMERPYRQKIKQSLFDQQ